VCDYSVAPVARYSPYWHTPVLSAGAMAHDFGADKRAPGAEYKLLTRVGVTVHSPDTETGLHGTYCESLEDATESHKNQLHSRGANCDSEVIMHDFVFLEIGKMTLNVTDLRITVTLRELTVTCL